MSVSDIGTSISQRAILAFLRQQVNETQRMANTGKKSTTIAGLGPSGASDAILYRNKSKVLDAYTDNLNRAKTQFKVMDQSISSITNAARETLQYLRTQMQDTSPEAAIISDKAQGNLNVILQKLNTETGGRYVFAGDDLYNPPFADPAALDASISAEIPGWLAGTTPNAVVTDARGIAGGALGYSATVLTSGNTSVRTGDSLDIDSTLRASEDGFSDVLRGMSIIANLPQPTTPAEQENYWNVVNGVIQLLDQGTKKIDEYQGALGNKAKMVDDLIMEHSETQATFEIFLGSVEDVDMAESSTLFQSLQLQLEASYNMISMTRDLSLINFL